MDTKLEVVKLLSKAAGLKESEVSEILEVPPSPELGDFALPCFKLAAKLKKAPQIIAKEISGKIKSGELIKEVKATGPYVNIFVNQSQIAENLIFNVLAKAGRFGEQSKNNQNVMIEFCHANTHKAFHIGHLRNIVLGESFSRVMEFNGFNVLRVNYQGDIGPHVAKCLWAYQKYHNDEVPKKDRGVWLGKIYAEGAKHHADSEEVQKEVAELTQKLYAGKDKKLMLLWKKTRGWSIEEFEKLYKELDVTFKEFYFESQVEAAGKKIALDMLKKGSATRDQGAIVVDLKKYDLGVCVILATDGHPLYTTKELGLAQKKLAKYNLDKSIHVVGQEQELFFKQMFKIYELLGWPIGKISHHLSYGLVMLPEGKMSSRLGEVVIYHDLAEKVKSKALEEVKKRNLNLSAAKQKLIADKVAIAALKFGMLKQSPDKTIIFDWERALEFEGDTGPYLQYAFVRARKIMQKAGKMPNKASFSLLQQPAEIALVKNIALFPEVVKKAGREYAPNAVANYAFELANTFSSFYETCPVISAESDGLKNMRLKLVQAFAQTLRNALYLLGIEEVEVM